MCVCVCVCIHRKGGHLPMSQLCGVIGTALFFDLYNTHTHMHMAPHMAPKQVGTEEVNITREWCDLQHTYVHTVYIHFHGLSSHMYT